MSDGIYLVSVSVLTWARYAVLDEAHKVRRFDLRDRLVLMNVTRSSIYRSRTLEVQRDSPIRY